MADYASYPDDISGLWGPDSEGTLTPAMPETSAGDPEALLPASTKGTGNGSVNGHSNGARLAMVEQETHDDVARLARAIADSHADVVRPADLRAARAEMEGAFTQQLAVALYELMAASNARFATAEEHINQRVDEAVEVHTNRLEASLDAHHVVATQMLETLGNELDALRQRFIGPIDGLAAFRRELRHEVGRLSDLVTTQARESAQQSAVEKERRERHDDWVVKAAGDLSGVSGVLAAIKEDLTALREDVAELRAAVEQGGQNGRKSSRWGRSR